MKRLTLTAILASLFLTSIATVSAQTVTTWLQPRTLTTNQTLLLGVNQVMEVTSLSMDESTSLDITIEGLTLTLGTGGMKMIPQPLAIAGPATIVMRRVAGDEGSLMTFRVAQIPKPAAPVAQVSLR